MIRTLAAWLLGAMAVLAPLGGLAQSSHGTPHKTPHEEIHGAHGGATPTQVGQSAFAAIQEIVEILEADPSTDWSKVNIDALRRHLVDMSNVTLWAEVRTEPLEGGRRFVVTGTGPVRDSIRRMVLGHAATMNGAGGWRFEAADSPEGAMLTVRPPAEDLRKLDGLGFFGIMTLGMHHQHHHLMIARGQNPHH